MSIKKQKGGKILGQGRDGCVTSPPYMCSKKLDPNTHVSKLINNKQVGQQAIMEEYKLGQKFYKADPKHKYFLPYVDMCQYKVSYKEVLADKARLFGTKYKDMYKCGFDTAGELDVTAMILPKGKKFDLRTKGTIKQIQYTNYCATIIQKLTEMNMVHLDIKPDNMLVYNDHPALIDFTPDFVWKSTQENFFNFSEGYGKTYYAVWPKELYLVTHVLRNDLADKKLTYTRYIDPSLMATYKHLYGEFVDEAEMAKMTNEFVNNTKIFFDKMMMWSIGTTLKLACGKNYPDIIEFMTDDYDERLTSTEFIDMVKIYLNDDMTGPRLPETSSPSKLVYSIKHSQEPSKKSIKSKKSISQAKKSVSKFLSKSKKNDLPFKSPKKSKSKKLLSSSQSPKNLKDISSLSTEDMVVIINKNSKTPSMNSMSTEEIKKQILLYGKSLPKTDNKSELYKSLKKLRSKKVSPKAKKSFLIKLLTNMKILKK